MATYRTIRMAFWSDPYIETLSASEKLLYLYLFSCPHTNNLGLLAVSRRRMAYDTGLTEEAARGLERLLDDLADTRGTCVAALANLRGGLAAHDPARLVLAAEALSAVSLELAYCSGDAARMGAALTLCGEEEGGYAQ